MEKELNIAAILKDKPLNTKLWTDMYGEVTLESISKNGNGFNIIHHKGVLEKFLPNGKLYEEGSLCIYPSREMQSWEKLAWKKGDVLRNIENDELCIFDKFNAKYDTFKGLYNSLYQYGCRENATKYWEKVTDEILINEYIAAIEKQFGGKLNLSTLQIEQSKQEFKDGDIVFVKGTEYYNDYIEIFSHFDDGEIYDHASYNIKKAILDCSGNYQIDKDEYQDIRLATDSEKQQLYDALAKEKKAWDSEKKMVVDLPKKCEFEPFQKVLVRCKDYQKWKVDFFSHYDDSCKGFPYVCVSSRKSFCIPYNDQTKHLLGTNKEW